MPKKKHAETQPTLSKIGTSQSTKSKKNEPRPLAVIDLETDPFEYGRVPKAFAAGFYDGERFVHFWGDSCLIELVNFLGTLPRAYVVYAHNGGRFDFLFLLEWLQNPLKIIAGRVVSARLAGHELRDSFAILPVPLASYEKTTIDYRKFERAERDAHRAEIVDYLRDDCVDLFELVSKFRERFGSKITIGSTAIKELKEIHGVPKSGAAHDARFRRFYYGGRVECFESGVIRDDLIIADVNSMYPHAMANFSHPVGRAYSVSGDLHLDDERLMFATIEATSRGALPVRDKTGLHFPHGRMRFDATAHEIRAGIETGLLDVHRTLAAFYAEDVMRFDGFVSEFMADKLAAEERGDKAGRLFAKLVLNSAYGKFATNPENFGEFRLRRPDEELPPEEWELYADHGFIEVWKKPAPIYDWQYYDVATAASITGASRAELLRAIASAERPLYCDTDSLICKSLNARIDAHALGAWKIEARADMCAIAGKKLYACAHAGEFVKWASKGVKLDPETIVDIAGGRVYKYMRDAPSVTLRGFQFIERNVKGTV